MQKKAFLFSAGNYLNSKTLSVDNLFGVKYDVIALEKRFKQIGFEIIKKENAYKSDYISMLKKNIENIPSDAICVVYFSGHGGHFNGKNYIFPSDFGSLFDVSGDFDNAALNIEDIISVFKGKGRLILILDACRSDDINLSKGYYSEMAFAENVYIAYGTMFENTSIGVNNGLSWFTESICDEILTPNIDVDTLFTRVRQNIFAKHYVQIPPSTNALLDKVVLHSELSYDDMDKQVYDFIQKYGNQYEDKYGCFHGDDLIFIDAAQYFDIGLLDAIWKFKKVDNKIYKAKGVKVPELSEAETKVQSFLGFLKGKRYFTFDESHTWYYNGRQIRMGEIPPLPSSMQAKLPEYGKEYYVNISAIKENGRIIISTNLPEKSEILFQSNKSDYSQKLKVSKGKVVIDDAEEIQKVVIRSGVYSSDEEVQQILGDKCCNLVGEFIKYHPIHGNQLDVVFEFKLD